MERPYNYELECQHKMDFYNLDHYIEWIGLYGDCKNGCKDKLCEQKEMIVNGVKVKFNEVEVEK